MKVFKGLPTCFEYKSTVLTIGIFDGVHPGHQQIMKDVVSSGIKKKSTSLVLTFDPHPQKVLFDRELLFLSTLGERIEAISQLGIEVLIAANFTREIASFEPEEFARELLVQRLKMKELWIGHDFRFGRGRQGDIELLKRLGEELDFQVKVVEPVKSGDEIISSTRIRNYLIKGEVQKAALLLGRHYSVKGKVISGEKRGKTVGYPTANLEWEKGVLLPALGVYAVEATLENKKYPGVANLGFNPTFDGKKLSLEIYLFDFNQEIYSASLRAAFIQRLRDERKFASPEELSTQIKKDEIAAKESLKILNRK